MASIRDQATSQHEASAGLKPLNILTAVACAVVATNESGRILYANPAVHDILGWEPNDLVGRPVTVLTPPRLRGLHIAAFERYMQTGIPTVSSQPLHVPACAPDGTERDVVLTLSPEDLDDGRIVVATMVALRRDEIETPERDELHLQLDFTHAIMRSLGDGVYALDREGRVIYMNDAAERMLGWTETELLGLDMHDMIHHRREDGVEVRREDCPLVSVLESGITYHSKSDVFLRRDGSMLPVAYTSSPIVSDGEVVGAALSFQDRTAERRLEREKDLFLSAVAHDLRSPMTSIKGFTQLLLRRARRGAAIPGSQMVSHLERIEATTDRVVGLVDELLDITRVRMGRSLDLVLRRCDLLTIVREVVDTMMPGARRKVLIDSDREEVVGEWDAGRLQRVVTNLLSNAIKYSPDGSCIRLRVSCDDSFAELEVSNEGIGIPAADLPYIFDQFRRGGNVQGHLPGAGIGLASAQHVVTHHGGTISARSDEGNGATFIVRLPRQSPPIDPESLLEPVSP